MKKFYLGFLLGSLIACSFGSLRASFSEAITTSTAIAIGGLVGTGIGHRAGNVASEALLKYYFLFIDKNWRQTLLPGLFGSFISKASFPHAKYAYEALSEQSESFCTNLLSNLGKNTILTELEREVNRLKPIGSVLGLISGGICGALAAKWFMETVWHKDNKKPEVC